MIKDVDSATLQKAAPGVALIVVGFFLVILGLAMSTVYYLAQYSWSAIISGAIIVVLFLLLGRRVVQFTIGGANWLTLSVRKLGTREKVQDFINKFFELKDRISKA
ncbi:hypothetical protein ES707_02906 [subsurface metagenome]